MATAGNLSARASDTEVVITATGRHKGELGDGDFVRCRLAKLASDEAARTSSSDSIIHHTIYRHLEQVGAVYHVHEPHAVALSSRRASDEYIAFEGYSMVKALGVTDVQATTSVRILPDCGRAERLTERLDDLFSSHPNGLAVPGIIAERHGLYAWGESMFEARRHVEALAHLCECELLRATHRE